MVRRFAFLLFMALSFLGLSLGVVSLMIPGKVAWIRLNKKPVETVGEKLTVCGTSLLFLGLGYSLERKTRWKGATSPSPDPPPGTAGSGKAPRSSP